MASTKVSEITLPEHYVRDKIRSQHVNDLLDVVASHNGVKDWKELIGKKVKWPFNEIDLGKNLTAKPEKVKTKKGEKKPETKRWFPLEIIDGAHRWTVAKRLKMKEIDAITRNIDNPSDRYLHQYRTNVGHGLRLDKDARDNAIRIMATVYKMSQKDLVKETGLDTSSVSRIIASKQRKDGPRKAKEKGKSTGPATGGGANDGMTVTGFLERLQILVEESTKLLPNVLSHLVSNVPKSKYPALKEFAGKVRAISEVIDDAIKPESQPTEPV